MVRGSIRLSAGIFQPMTAPRRASSARTGIRNGPGTARRCCRAARNKRRFDAPANGPGIPSPLDCGGVMSKIGKNDQVLSTRISCRRFTLDRRKNQEERPRTDRRSGSCLKRTVGRPCKVAGIEETTSPTRRTEPPPPEKAETAAPGIFLEIRYARSFDSPCPTRSCRREPPKSQKVRVVPLKKSHPTNDTQQMRKLLKYPANLERCPRGRIPGY